MLRHNLNLNEHNPTGVAQNVAAPDADRIINFALKRNKKMKNHFAI